MTVHVRRFVDPIEFGEAATSFLAEKEAENCLLLGLIATLSRGDSIYKGDNYFAVLESADGIAGAALMTPPFGPLISRMTDPQAIDALIENLLPRRDEIGSVTGPAESSRAFADHWATLTGQSTELTIAQRIFQLTRVVPPKPVPGVYREATGADRSLLSRLVRAFYLESSGPGAVHLGKEDEVVAARLGKDVSGYVLWEDGEAVCVAGYGNPTPQGAIVGPVYTPPEFRGRGYASALTAALSQDLLDRGRSFVFLFTNLANPISIHIYRKIGYEAAADVDQWTFIAPE